jgi:selenocysteine-specific elongation factor
VPLAGNLRKHTALGAGVTSLVLGVIGHVDHGKTALVRALTGVNTDRLPEEKRRGISIALGFAHLKTGLNADIDLIDMPGHERFVRTMISGATGIDAVLLVLAANEGIKPQTVEHVNIAGLLGLRRAVIAISKTDLVAPEQAGRVAEEAVRLLARSGLDCAGFACSHSGAAMEAARATHAWHPLPPVMTSALQEKGIEELRQALNALAADQQQRAADGMAFLPLDRAFTVAGHGPVATGTLRGAAVTTGDALELFPSRRRVRVRAIQVHGMSVATAVPGQRVALNLRDVEIAELKRGMALAAPDTLALSDWLTISVRAVEGAPPLKNGMRLRALLGTGEFDARLRLLDRDVLEAGQSGFAQLHFVEAVALPSGEHVVLRLLSPAQTVAGGKVLDLGTRRQRRKSAPILNRLEDLRALPPAAMIAAEVQREGPAGTTLRHLSQLSALATPRIIQLLQTLPVVVTRSGLVVWKEHMDNLLSRIPTLLALHATGLSHAKLLSALPETGAAVLDEALGRLRARGAICERGSQLLVPRPDEDRARAHNEVELALQIAETLRRAGLSPPNPAAIVTDPQSKRAVDRLLRAGLIVRAVDRAKGREILFHQDAIEEARRRLAPLLERAPGLLVTEVGEALGISRKYSMPLLDHLDTIRFTRRINDRRVRAGTPTRHGGTANPAARLAE